MRRLFDRRALRGLLCVVGVALSVQLAEARTADKVTYLLPAPKEAIVFAPLVLAEQLGRYRQAKLDVTFVVLPGGFKVGEALGRGEGDLGGASGDTPILLRAANVPVKGIALLGRHAFLTLVTRRDSFADSSGFDGKRIDVPSFKDTSYYALQNLARQSAANIKTQARAPGDLITALGNSEIDGFVGTVDWGVKAERAGMQLDYRKVDEFYPAMAQAILASETTIATRPQVLRRFIRATLKTIDQIAKNPERSAIAYEKAVPRSGYSHAEIVRTFKLLATQVYGKGSIGRFHADIVRAAETEALKRSLITDRRAPDAYYTNEFSRK